MQENDCCCNPVEELHLALTGGTSASAPASLSRMAVVFVMLSAAASTALGPFVASLVFLWSVRVLAVLSLLLVAARLAARVATVILGSVGPVLLTFHESVGRRHLHRTSPLGLLRCFRFHNVRLLGLRLSLGLDASRSSRSLDLGFSVNVVHFQILLPLAINASMKRSSSFFCDKMSPKASFCFAINARSANGFAKPFPLIGKHKKIKIYRPQPQKRANFHSDVRCIVAW